MNKINYIIAAVMALSFSSFAYAEGESPSQTLNKQIENKDSKDKIYSIRDEDELKITIRKLEDMKKLEKARLEYNKAMVESSYYESKMESGEAIQELRDAEKKKDSGAKSPNTSPAPSPTGLGTEIPVYSPSEAPVVNSPVKKEERVSVSVPQKTYGPQIDIHSASIVNFKKRIVGIDRESGEVIYLYKGDKFGGYTVESISLDSVTFRKGKKRYVRAVLPTMDTSFSDTSSSSDGATTDSSVPVDPISVPPGEGPLDGVMGLPSATNYPTMNNQ